MRAMTDNDHLLNKFVIINIEVILNIYKVFRNIGPTHFINKFAIITIEVIYLSMKYLITL